MNCGAIIVIDVDEIGGVAVGAGDINLAVTNHSRYHAGLPQRPTHCRRQASKCVLHGDQL